MLAKMADFSAQAQLTSRGDSQRVPTDSSQLLLQEKKEHFYRKKPPTTHVDTLVCDHRLEG